MEVFDREISRWTCKAVKNTLGLRKPPSLSLSLYVSLQLREARAAQRRGRDILQFTPPAQMTCDSEAPRKDNRELIKRG